MPAFTKKKTSGPEGVDTVFSAHIQTALGADITKSAGAGQVSAITYTITEQVGPQQNVVTGLGTLVVASTVYDTLQTGSGWYQDNSGFNFQATLPGAQFPDAGEYIVVFLLTLASGGTPFPVECFHHAYSTS